MTVPGQRDGASKVVAAVTITLLRDLGWREGGNTRAGTTLLKCCLVSEGTTEILLQEENIKLCDF